MRTTLTLDEDIALTLRERARLLDLPFKQVVNETLRRGLSPEPNEAMLPGCQTTGSYRTKARLLPASTR